MHIVLDTNVIISGILFPFSTPGKAFDIVLVEHKLLMSAETVAELEEVLLRPKFDKYLDDEDRAAYLESIFSKMEPILIGIAITDCRDPKDNKFLELAVSGNADLIISGDDDLLVLNPFRGIPIKKPQDFLELFNSQ